MTPILVCSHQSLFSPFYLIIFPTVVTLNKLECHVPIKEELLEAGIYYKIDWLEEC